jgi:5-methyltetrahydropteroyltriglutamate--homocysteine methyltransferase
MLFPTTIAGSLPKPGWLAETHKLWPKWRQEGAELARAKRDATLLWLKIQEDAGIDCVTEGEQSRQHFVHGFVEFVAGIDTEHKVAMGIRNNRYEAIVPQIVAPLKLKGRAHETEAKLMHRHTKRETRFTLPGPMTIMDTVKDAFYGDRIKTAMAFADLLNAEARALEKDGIDVIQFDEPAFNAYTDEAARWGIEALHRALDGLTCKTAVHICYGYGIKANIDWKLSLGSEWRQYEAFSPALAKSRVDQVALECMHSHVPPSVMALLAGKEVIVGAIDVASNTIETPEEIAEMVGAVLKYVPKEKVILGTNCGLAPLDCDVAVAKLDALGKGAVRARLRFG